MGNKAEDSSGTGNDGKIEGGAKWVNGKFGKGLSLNGSDAYVEIAHDDSLNVGGEHTIALWFKLHNAPPPGMGVVTKDDWAPGFWWDATRIRHHTHDPAPHASLYRCQLELQIQTGIILPLLWDGEEFRIYLDAEEIGAGVTTANIGRNRVNRQTAY